MEDLVRISGNQADRIVSSILYDLKNTTSYKVIVDRPVLSFNYPIALLDAQNNQQIPTKH